MTPFERELIARAAQTQPRPPIPCTRCHYCMPCPSDVNIPVNLNIYNRMILSGQRAEAQAEYLQQPAERRASACVHCQNCETICPQKIAVSEWMERLVEMFFSPIV